MKLIIYLDQNWLSEIAKAFLLGRENGLTAYYKELFLKLKELTKKNLIICPASPFHRQESEPSSYVKDINWQVEEDLSFGVSFLYNAQIHDIQLVEAAISYCKLPVEKSPLWRKAFSVDPHLQISADENIRFSVHLPDPDAMNSYSQEFKELIGSQYAKYKVSRKGKSSSFDEEVKFNKDQLIYETFSSYVSSYESVKEFRAGKTLTEAQILFDFLALTGVMQRQKDILKIVEKSKEPRGFFTSKELLACDFLHIRASLMAADIFYYPNQEPSPSLNTDFEIASAVIPFVDYFATDSYLSELIKQSGILSKYNARIIPSNSLGREKLMNLLSALES